MAHATMKRDETETAIGTCGSDEEDEGMNVVTQSEKSDREYGESSALSEPSSSSLSCSTPPPCGAASEDDGAFSSASAVGAEDDSTRRRREETAAAGVGGGDGFATDGGGSAADDDDQVGQGMKASSASARAPENATKVEDQMGDGGMSQVMRGMNMASASASAPSRTYSDGGMASESSASTSVVDPTDVAARQRLKWRMNLFVFVQVLMKYLEKVDPSLCTKAKKVVKECSRKKNAGDPAYKSLAVSIQVCLRQTVGEYHWVRAEQLMRQAHFRSQRSGGGGTKPKPKP